MLAAGQTQTPESKEALATLCEKYWQPLYAYTRRRGYTVEQAQDLTQEFFARLIEKNYLAAARPDRGRFRSFLLTALKHFLAKELECARAQKRGGGQVLLSLDFDAAEGGYQAKVADDETPETVYERRWAVTLLDQSLRRLRTEYAQTGKEILFCHLKEFLTSGGSRTPYAQVAVKLGISEGAVKVAVHRLRNRFGALLREEVAQTLPSPIYVEDELRGLFSVLT